MKTNLLNSLLFIAIACSTLSCKKNKQTTKEADEKTLATLRSEIDELSNTVTCENSAEWKFVAIGAKACGGPTGYVAYNTKIDVAKFLTKVENYTVNQKKFNAKWGVASDCALVASPKRVDCINGKPKLVY